MISKTSLEILEFSKLLRLISDFTHSEISRNSVLQIEPLQSKGDMEHRLNQVQEIRRLSHEGDPLKLSDFSDISPLLTKLRPEEAILEPRELSEFIPFLEISSALFSQIKDKDYLPNLRELAGGLTGFPAILQILLRSIDGEGNILDSASFPLSDIRARIRKLEGKIRKKLEEITRDEKISVFLQDEFITMRSGRWVIPVRMDSKGMVPGVVHDVSKSGETAFIEPLGIIHLANELENLFAEQKAEEIRILRNICSHIRAVINDMETEFRTVLYLDVLNSIATFSDVLDMSPPQINETGVINLVKARHPLLHLTLKRASNDRHVVPLDVSLGGDNTVMVITGPNAGGKTIAIKTVGLLLLMALSGMPVPADSSSVFPLANDLLVDIGDEQSIEDNLSTFSAHISNISEILRKTDAATIVLIDELGTGTDPEEGAAISCAILNEIRRCGALLFATTHLSDIKAFVHRTAGMVNASMEFDQKTLNPLYRLRIGEPGQSHALEIARSYGLPESIIREAKEMLGSLKIEFDNLIATLNEKRSEYDSLLEEIRRQHHELEEKQRELDKMIADTKDRGNEILARACQEASAIVADTKRQMHVLLDEIKKEKDKDKIKKVIKEVESAHAEIITNIIKYEAEQAPLSLYDLKKGDVVFVKSLGYDAEIVDLNSKDGRLRVRSGNKEIEVPPSDIGRKRGKEVAAKSIETEIRQSDVSISSRISLVGLRVDDALSRLERFLNDAAVAELEEITVVHGIGKGLLMKAIHQHLDGHPLVKSWRSGTRQEGGNGVTIVKLA
ncbi:MAG: endonuclease MutS2 [Nitrospirota bacterium]